MAFSILVVEDNPDMRDTLASFLKSEGFDVREVASTEEGIDAVDENKFDIGLVDINLPGKSGFDMVEYIRDQGLEFPVIALTARDSINDKVKGFDSGLNDYVIKPFNLRELLARVHAHLRHNKSEDTEAEISTNRFVIQPKSFRFSVDGKQTELTQLEFKMMHLLMMHHDSLVKLDDLIDFVWGESDDLVNPPIRIHIANLRKKIGDTDYRVIKTVPGTGYILRDDDNAA